MLAAGTSEVGAELQKQLARSGLPARYQKGRFLGKDGTGRLAPYPLILTFSELLVDNTTLFGGIVFLPGELGASWSLFVVHRKGGFAKCYEVQDLETKEIFAASLSSPTLHSTCTD